MQTCLVTACLLLPAPGMFAPCVVAAEAPRSYESKNFTIHTDLPKPEAEQLLVKLETMLGLISRYWAVPNRRRLECYVVADLTSWPAGTIDPRAIPSLRSGGGVTLADFRRAGNRTAMQAVAFAVARTGTVQHEAVHAFSYHAFGTCGPQWYAEGMAEVGTWWIEGKTTVNAPQYVTEYLRTATRPTVREIVGGETQKLGWQTYAWRWALCHMLGNNTNYSTKFRPLGISLLTHKRLTFSGAYGRQMDQLQFEYDFFLDHVEPGFDAARCSWDWKTRFRTLKPGRTASTTVHADHAWQASGVRVREGQTYRITAAGEWKTAADAPAVSVSGDSEGHGALEGLILTRFQASVPFRLGASRTWTAGADGNLYLRCADSLSELADNSGSVEVSFEAHTPTDEPDQSSGAPAQDQPSLHGP